MEFIKKFWEYKSVLLREHPVLGTIGCIVVVLILLAIKDACDDNLKRRK